VSPTYQSGRRKYNAPPSPLRQSLSADVALDSDRGEDDSESDDDELRGVLMRVNTNVVRPVLADAPATLSRRAKSHVVAAPASTGVVLRAQPPPPPALVRAQTASGGGEWKQFHEPGRCFWLNLKTGEISWRAPLAADESVVSVNTGRAPRGRRSISKTDR
jgi:hypothetical protein